MSSEHIQARPHAMVRPTPRLGALRVVMLDRLARLGQAVWQALEAHGRRRGDRELLALAERWQASNPKLARELRSYVRGGSSSC